MPNKKSRSPLSSFLPVMAIMAGVLSLVAGVMYVQYRQTIDSQAASYTHTTDPSTVFDIKMVTGLPSDIPLAGRWRQDTTAALPVLFRNGTWFFFSSTNATATPAQQISFGQAGDKPVLCDLNGDGIQTPAVFRNGTWYFRNDISSGTANSTAQMTVPMTPGAMPLCGDWDGNGSDEIGVYLRETGRLYTREGDPRTGKIVTTDFPVDANSYFIAGKFLTYRGDKVTRFGRIQALGSVSPTGAQKFATTLFYMPGSTAPQPSYANLTITNTVLGANRAPQLSDIQPVVADWNGDGRVDLSVRWNGQWYVKLAR